MDLTQSLMSIVNQHLIKSALLAATITISACATTAPDLSETNQTTQVVTEQAEPQIESAESEAVKTEAIAEPVTPVEPPLPLTPELMYYILTAEVAGQRKELGASIQLYKRAAEIVDSPALAKRSVEVALVSRDPQLIEQALQRWEDVDPNDPEVYKTEVPVLLMKKDFDGAVAATNKAIALAPDQTKVLAVDLSQNLAELAAPTQALASYEKLDVYRQKHPDALFAHARLLFYYQQYEQALAEISPLLKVSPDDQDYLILKADVLQRLDRTDEGIAVLEKPAQSPDASDLLVFTYAKLLGDNGQSAKARTIFEGMLDKNANNRDALFAMGLLALQEEQPKQAKPYFSQLMKLGDPSQQAGYFMGVAEEMDDNLDAALLWYGSVPPHSNRFDQAQNEYIEILLQRDQLDKVRKHLANLRQQLPNKAINYYLFEASLLRDFNQKQAAFDLLTEAIKKYPQNKDLLYSRAMVAEPLDKLDVLESDLRAILKQDPDNSAALNALGYTLADRTDRYQEAYEMIRRAIELKPGDPFYLDSLGWVYYRLGELDKAEKYLRQATEANADAEFIAHLGEVLWENGKQQEAKKVWEKGLKKQADNPLLLETMKRYGL